MGSEREKVMFSNGNGDESSFGKCKPDTCQCNKTDFSPRARAYLGFSPTASPMSLAPQNLKLLEEDTGWTLVADNTKISPVQDKATTLSPLIANCLTFWNDHNERLWSLQHAKSPDPSPFPGVS